MLILAEEKDILIHKIQQSCAFWFHKFKVKHIYPLLYKYIALLWEGVILLTYIITSSLYIEDTIFDTCAYFLKWTYSLNITTFNINTLKLQSVPGYFLHHFSTNFNTYSVCHTPVNETHLNTRWKIYDFFVDTSSIFTWRN